MCDDESWDQHGPVVDLSGHDRVVGVQSAGGEVCGLQVGVDCG